MADTLNASRTLTALFDTEAEAQRAAARLRDLGLAETSIRVTAGDTSYDPSTYSGQNKGFWESLGDFFFPDEDRYTYAEALSRGAHIVSVHDFDEAHRDQIVDILDDEGSIDVDAREEEWRSSGWTDYRGSDYYDETEYARGRSGLSPAAAGMASATAAAGGMPARGTVYDDGLSDRDATIGGTERVGEYQMSSDAAGGVGSATNVGGSDYDRTGAAVTRADDLRGAGAATASGGALDDEGRLQIVEENLRVGKRSVEEGAVRVRSYVREEPVSAEVDLRSTRVFIDRRPVDRAAGAGDLAFEDRTIEARSSREEAVVQKEARVVEEIGLRQESDTRTETVSDTVRRTEVEIEDERTGETQRITGDATRDPA